MQLRGPAVGAFQAGHAVSITVICSHPLSCLAHHCLAHQIKRMFGSSNTYASGIRSEHNIAKVQIAVEEGAVPCPEVPGAVPVGDSIEVVQAPGGSNFVSRQSDSEHMPVRGGARVQWIAGETFSVAEQRHTQSSASSAVNSSAVILHSESRTLRRSCSADVTPTGTTAISSCARSHARPTAATLTARSSAN